MVHRIEILMRSCYVRTKVSNCVWTNLRVSNFSRLCGTSSKNAQAYWHISIVSEMNTTGEASERITWKRSAEKQVKSTHLICNVGLNKESIHSLWRPYASHGATRTDKWNKQGKYKYISEKHLEHNWIRENDRVRDRNKFLFRLINY